MDNQAPTQQTIEIAGKEALQRLKDAEESQKWKVHTDKPCKICTMKVDGRVVSKGETIINYPINHVNQFLKSNQYASSYTQGLEDHVVLKKFNDNLEVIYESYTGEGPFSARDFVMVAYLVEREDKCYMACSSSDYPYPEVKGKVRGHLYVGGFITQRVSEQQTKVIYIQDSDLKGSIPQMIQNKICQEQGALVSYIEPAMKKFK